MSREFCETAQTDVGLAWAVQVNGRNEPAVRHDILHVRARTLLCGVLGSSMINLGGDISRHSKPAFFWQDPLFWLTHADLE